MESRKRTRRKAARSRVVAKPAIAQSQYLPNITALIDNGGDITVGALPPIRCVATACAEYGCLAMLQRRPRESLQHLLERLDAAIELAETEETVIDEINSPSPAKTR
jgi:hypothetical protein